MIGYRITFQDFIRDLSGTGSEIFGGRWNPIGTSVLYSSQTVGTSAMEFLVNLDSKLAHLKIALAVIEFPGESIKEIDESDLPDDWRTYPAPQSLAALGQDWLDERKFLVLSVPSSVVLLERNFIINPKHELFKEVKIKSTHEYKINERIIKKMKL